MPSFVDLTGQKYGRLTPKRRATVLTPSGRKLVAWACECECGKKTTVLACHLRSGKTRSCGCLNVEKLVSRRHIDERVRDHPNYGLWCAMIRRCHNPNAWNYKFYGGRGIKVCHRWRFGAGEKSGFVCFLNDMGVRPEGLTIDRINNDGNYEPSNCRWATVEQQTANKRRRKAA